MRGISVSAAVLLAGAFASSLCATPAQANTTGWSLTSAYSFSGDVQPASSGLAFDTVVRVTFDVPDSKTSLIYDVDGAAAKHGGDQVVDGHLVLDVGESLASGESVQPFTVTFRDTEGGPVLWKATVTDVQAAVPTKLTIDALPAKVAAGKSVKVTGTLTAAGKPVVGHWVNLLDFRENCATDRPCESSALELASAKTDARGHWKTTVPVKNTVHVVATYCFFESYCWGNRNAPAFVHGRTIAAHWAPTLALPTKVRKGRAATYAVNVPAALAGVPVKLQAWLQGRWRTVAATKVTTSRKVQMRARLSKVGKTKVRADVPAFSYQPFGEKGAWRANRIKAGATTKIVTVLR